MLFCYIKMTEIEEVLKMNPEDRLQKPGGNIEK